MSNMDRLTAAGFSFGGATPAQAEALAGLSESEVSTLVSVKQRIDAAGPDVEGHVADSTGGWLW